MSKPQGVCVLGSTGSIGESTLDVIARNPDKLRLIAASAYNNIEKMLKICQEHEPEVVVMVEEAAADKLRQKISPNIDILSGCEALDQIAALNQVDLVMAAIVGAAGLNSTMAAIKADKKVLLANKEALVMSGGIFMHELQNSKAKLIPIDSEHNAIFQCLPDDFVIGSKLYGINRILLTGSGGPFLNDDIYALANKTPQQAVSHPNWSMGAKISVDSATMMNKGLEWIEAKWLFGIADEKLEILIHPQSIIHSMVEFNDGSTLAQMGQSDMRIPIAHAFGLPKRINSGVSGLNFADLPLLEFLAPDYAKFPALKLIRQAWEAGGTATTILNAANEIAVKEFLTRKIKFTDIVKIISKSLEQITINQPQSISDVMAADKKTRNIASRISSEFFA